MLQTTSIFPISSYFSMEIQPTVPTAERTNIKDTRLPYGFIQSRPGLVRLRPPKNHPDSPRLRTSRPSPSRSAGPPRLVTHGPSRPPQGRRSARTVERRLWRVAERSRRGDPGGGESTRSVERVPKWPAAASADCWGGVALLGQGSQRTSKSTRASNRMKSNIAFGRAFAEAGGGSSR